MTRTIRSSCWQTSMKDRRARLRQPSTCRTKRRRRRKRVGGRMRLGEWGTEGLGVAAVFLLASMGFAQSPSPPDTQSRVSTRASDKYDRSGLWRFLFGEDWRDTWSARITVPVLDLGRYAGGLKPYRRGGNQSHTLRFHGGDGRTY